MKNKTKFSVSVQSVKKIYELPESWSAEECKQLLQFADFENVDSLDTSELKDYAIMLLQDQEPAEAAETVLTYKFGSTLKTGQIQNLAHEMMDEKLWEEYQDISLHKELYNTSVLMKEAFPKKFPETNALKCTLSVGVANDPMKQTLLQADKAFVARMLAHGMDDHALINRLFDTQVSGDKFPEAESIIWDYQWTSIEGAMVLTVHSSHYWLHYLDEVGDYESIPYND
ncbi:MAG: hypothetical protein RIC35_14225 [Marinoscillum sp.]